MHDEPVSSAVPSRKGTGMMCRCCGHLISREVAKVTKEKRVKRKKQRRAKCERQPESPRAARRRMVSVSRVRSKIEAETLESGSAEREGHASQLEGEESPEKGDKEAAMTKSAPAENGAVCLNIHAHAGNYE